MESWPVKKPESGCLAVCTCCSLHTRCSGNKLCCPFFQPAFLGKLSFVIKPCIGRFSAWTSHKAEAPARAGLRGPHLESFRHLAFFFASFAGRLSHKTWMSVLSGSSCTHSCTEPTSGKS